MHIKTITDRKGVKMLLVKTIIIYSDKDYYNYAINTEWVEVENYGMGYLKIRLISTNNLLM
jgi:hypothetical protein